MGYPKFDQGRTDQNSDSYVLATGVRIPGMIFAPQKVPCSFMTQFCLALSGHHQPFGYSRIWLRIPKQKKLTSNIGFWMGHVKFYRMLLVGWPISGKPAVTFTLTILLTWRVHGSSTYSPEYWVVNDKLWRKSAVLPQGQPWSLVSYEQPGLGESLSGWVSLSQNAGLINGFVRHVNSFWGI